MSVKEIKKETEDCVSVVFELTAEQKADFTFVQGQNLTLKKTIGGEEQRRSYSICTSPFDNELRVAIKKVDGGVFSTWANEALKPGDIIDVLPPTGKFNTTLEPLQKKRYLAFAAGSGITPVLSIIKTTLLTEPKSEFILVYGNKHKNSIIFKEQLEALKDKFISRFTLLHILSRERTEAPVNSGRIDPLKLVELGRLINYSSIDDFFICGPEEMIFCVRDFLLAKNIDGKKIHFELFTTPGINAGAVQRTKPVESEGESSRISVKLDGRSFDFDLPFNSDSSILDAALKEGADLPFACKGGVCCTCKARLLEGEVEMDVHWGLEEDEVKEGYILTCQSHPKTKKVVVDFDVK